MIAAWLTLVVVVAAAPEGPEALTPQREAGAAADGDVDEKEQEAATENGVSARVLAGGAGVEGGIPMLGVGVAYEREVAEGLMAVELALEGFTAPDGSALLFEVVFEKPIELNDAVDVYFGGGPTVVYHVPKRGQAILGWGGLVLIGTEFAIAGGFAVFVELDTAVVMLNKPVIEADVGTGVMYRF